LLYLIFYVLLPRPPTSTPFPYTTLFRSRFPGFRRNVEGHVNHHGRADDVVARNTPPEPAVVRIGAIITHDKIAVGGNPVRYFQLDRKSTRLNSSHDQISYAVFCLKKKIK